MLSPFIASAPRLGGLALTQDAGYPSCINLLRWWRPCGPCRRDRVGTPSMGSPLDHQVMDRLGSNREAPVPAPHQIDLPRQAGQ